MNKLSLLKAPLLVLLLALTYKPVKANSIVDMLLFALPFAAIEIEDNYRHRGPHKHAPTFQNFHNQLTSYRSEISRTHHYTAGHCVPYKTTEKQGFACKQSDGTWKIR